MLLLLLLLPRAALAAPVQGLPLAAPLLLLLLLLLLRILGRTIVCIANLALPGLELATTPLALANLQLSLLDRTCLCNMAQPEQCGSILEQSRHSWAQLT